jgi:ribosomal protein L16 Arg81 hydroxylase
MTAPSVISRLLAPILPEAFLAEHWNRRALHIPGMPEKFAGLFDRAAWKHSLPSCRSLKASYRDADGWLRDFPIVPEQTEHLFGAGMTICAGFLPETGPLGSLLAGLRRDLLTPAKPYFNCYYSPDGHGFNLHIDDHSVFILQIEGSKHWLFSSVPGVENPTRGFQFPPGRSAVKLPWGHFTRPETESLETVLLVPGDVLYLPPGTWHEARASGSSLALTLAYERVTAAAVVRETLAARLDHLGALAGPAPAVLAADGDPAPERFADLREALHQLVDDVGVEEFAAAWHRLAADPRPAGS